MLLEATQEQPLKIKGKDTQQQSAKVCHKLEDLTPIII
jgi:hypothetical protein